MPECSACTCVCAFCQSVLAMRALNSSKNIQSTDYQSSREALLKMDLSAETGFMCVCAVCECVYWPRLKKLPPMHLMSKSKLMVFWVTTTGKCFSYCWRDRRMIRSTATKQGSWVCHYTLSIQGNCTGTTARIHKLKLPDKYQLVLRQCQNACRDRDSGLLVTLTNLINHDAPWIGTYLVRCSNIVRGAR